jgi:signal transduction histidine kinase
VTRPPEAAAATDPPDATAPIQILVVDDTPSNLLALEAVLAQPEVTVVRAASGAEALALIQAHDYAVVILDVQMPVMGGLEVARRIREDNGDRTTPIIFLTAFEVDPRQVRRAYASGAVDFVVKPFDDEILRAKVSVFVDLFRKTREVVAQGVRLQAAQSAAKTAAVAEAQREWEAAAARARIERERDEANAREAELKRIDRLKDELLATLGHELRNPLMSLLSIAEVLDRQPVEDAAQARVHGVIRRQVAHLHRLVEDSLEISRFTQRKIELRPETVDLRDAVQQAIDLCRAAVESRGTDLSVTLPPVPVPITGDLVRLAQVVSNLLDNASKFSPRGGKVWISLETAAGEAILRVRDSGRGVRPDQLARIFEPFVQSESGDASRGGLGIGLALVKQLCELHGGRVTAASEGIGHGAELVVALPLGEPRRTASPDVAPPPPAEAHAAAPPPAARAAAAPRVRILVVDDNPEIRGAVQVFLEVEGHCVLTADSGRAALDQIERVDPDVVLLDIRLPDLDGYAVARQVRAGGHASRPRLVAMTGNLGPGERDRALRAGFDAHLRKPIDGRTLLRTIVGQ